MTGAVWELYAGNDLAARFVVSGGDFPWIAARVEPFAALEQVRLLFDRELALVEASSAEAVAEWEEAYRAVRGATALRYPDGRLVPEYLLDIEGHVAWWRWNDEPFTDNVPPVDRTGLVSLPPFFYLPGDPGEASPPGPRPASTIGHDLGTWLVASSGGQIWSVDTANGLPLTYVCRSAATLRAMLEILARRNERVRAHPDEAEDVEQLEAELASVDASAIVERASWWSVVLEQVSDGLL